MERGDPASRGAGQAGLATAFLLVQRHWENVVPEKAEVAER